VISLRVNQIDLVDKCIHLWPDETKNDDGREAPIENPTLLTLLATCIEGKSPDDPVFTWPADHRFRGRPVKDFRDRWERATKAAGVPNLLFHDLRRTAARNLRHAGVAESTIMKIGGWRTADVFRRYAIVDKQDMKNAMGKLEVSKAEAKSQETKLHQSLAKEAPETVQEQQAVRPN
jgi:integrase